MNFEESIYSTLPEEYNGDTDPHKKLLLRTFLQAHPGQFFKSQDIAKTCEFKSSHSCPELRKAITELIEFEGCPIVANSKGFAWAVHPNQIDFYIENLQYRIQGIQRRIEALKRSKGAI